MIHKIIFTLSVLLCAAISAAYAEEAKPAMIELTEKQINAVAAVQAKMNSIDTLVMPFTQMGYDGSFAEGTLYLKRPGKIRWQYDPPTPILIVGRGSSLTYYDYELEQISYVSLDDTLGSFLTRPHINFFEDDITITGVKMQDGLVSITFMQTEKPEEGKLMLTFDDYALNLRAMNVIDTLNQVTRVTFGEPRYSVSLEDKLFYIPNPKYNAQ